MISSAIDMKVTQSTRPWPHLLIKGLAARGLNKILKIDYENQRPYSSQGARQFVAHTGLVNSTHSVGGSV
jgi:hypothetical protein